MKQLQADPWDTVGSKFPIGSVHTGRVTNITDYGAFVELEAGVEGLVHVSEMSWTKKNVHPGKIVSTSQEVDVMVLEIDEAKRRVSLGLKQTMRNPWEVFAETHPVGTVIEGEVKNITEFGLFVGLEGDIDGMVHLSDISWDTRGEEAIQDFRKGDVVKAVVQEVDIEKERISLSIKALENDAMAEAVEGIKRGSVITVTVTAIEDGGIEVEYNGMKSSSAVRTWPATVRTSAPSASRSGITSMSASPTSTPRPAVWACRSRRAKSPKKKRPSNSMAARIRVPRWATSWALRSKAATEPTIG